MPFTTKSAQLLRSQSFHKMVGTIHKRVHQLRTGEKPAERGGTSIEGGKALDPDTHVQSLILQQIRIRPKHCSHILRRKSRTNFEI